jgi:hypothetical protein
MAGIYVIALAVGSRTLAERSDDESPAPGSTLPSCATSNGRGETAPSLSSNQWGGILSETVRYDGGNNAVLRLVLHTVWGQRCYWCNRPKDYNDIQIDHIVPRSQGFAGRHEILDAHRLSHNFDVDDPRNLAPICARRSA